MVAILLAAPALGQATAGEESLRQADAEQMRIIVDEDATAQQTFMHPNYMINAPSNRILRKAQLVAMLANGQMASEKFARKVEAVSITGNVGIVMGLETVSPARNSQLARQFGRKSLTRRFTNVFLFEDGRWRFLARQATVIGTPQIFDRRGAVVWRRSPTLQPFAIRKYARRNRLFVQNVITVVLCPMWSVVLVENRDALSQSTMFERLLMTTLLD